MSYGIYSQNPLDNYYLNKIKDLKDELRVTEHKDAVNTLLEEYKDKLLASQLYRVMFPDETSDSELEAACKRGKNIRLQIAIYKLFLVYCVAMTFLIVIMTFCCGFTFALDSIWSIIIDISGENYVLIGILSTLTMGSAAFIPATIIEINNLELEYPLVTLRRPL